MCTVCFLGLSFSPQKFDVNDIANDKKQTPLLWAAVMGRTEIAYLLLERGAFLEYVDFEGFKILMVFVYRYA